MENCGWASDLASTLEYPFRVFRFSLRSSAFWISVVPFFLLSTCWYSLFIKTDFIIFWINDFYVYIGLSIYSSCGTFFCTKPKQKSYTEIHLGFAFCFPFQSVTKYPYFGFLISSYTWKDFFIPAFLRSKISAKQFSSVHWIVPFVWILYALLFLEVRLVSSLPSMKKVL